jgi:hypothetical protein
MSISSSSSSWSRPFFLLFFTSFFDCFEAVCTYQHSLPQLIYLLRDPFFVRCGLLLVFFAHRGQASEGSTSRAEISLDGSDGNMQHHHDE